MRRGRQRGRGDAASRSRSCASRGARTAHAPAPSGAHAAANRARRTATIRSGRRRPGSALRRAHAVEAARLHRRRRPDARPRYRRQHRHLQPSSTPHSCSACPCPNAIGWSTCSGRRTAVSSRTRCTPRFATAVEPFDGIAAWSGFVASLNAGDGADRTFGYLVTGNFFDVLGLAADRGRLLSPADDVTPGGHPVVVISRELWQTRFAGRPDIIGHEIRLNGERVHDRRRDAGGLPRSARGDRASPVRADDDAADPAAAERPAAEHRELAVSPGSSQAGSNDNSRRGRRSRRSGRPRRAQ